MSEQQTVELDRGEALELLSHCGWKSAGRWKNDRLAEKLGQVATILTEETEHPSDPKIADNLIKVLAGIESKCKFKVTGSEVEAPAVKPAEEAPKTVTQETVKEATKDESAKPVVVADSEAPAVEGKKRGRKKKVVETETVPVADAEEIPEEVPETDLIPQSKTTVEVVDGLTAEGAQGLLGEKNANNDANRKFGSGLSKRYQNLMLTGGWDFGLRAHVIIGTDNKIHNTQHVLTALVNAEKARKADPKKYPKCRGPIKLDVVIERGIQPSSANFIDIGKPRTHPDIIYRQRLFDSKFKEAAQSTMSRWAATAARIVYNRCELGKKVRSPDKFEHASLVAIVDQNSGLIKSAEFIFDLDKAENHVKCIKALKVSPAYLVAAHYLASNSVQENGDPMRDTEANEFFQKLAFGEGLTEESPIYVLREWLLLQGGSKGNEKLNRIYDAIVVAWNAFEKKTTITAKQLSSTKPAAYPEMGGLDVRPA